MLHKLFHYLYVNCQLLRNSQIERSQPFGGWEAEENGTDKGKGRLRKDRVWSGCSQWRGRRSDFCAINHISRVPMTLTLSTPWMRAHLETVVCKCGRNLLLPFESRSKWFFFGKGGV